LIYLLDTCVVSEFVRPQPSNDLIQWLSITNDVLLAISVITLGEIQKGISGLEQSQRKDRLQEWLSCQLIPRFDNRILPISADDAVKWGELMGDAKRQGCPLPATDTLIAATAMNRHLTLVTRNTKDFERMGVSLLNPWR